jgi:predicted Zn-ribbon and HTH transcriptional regulator
MIKQICAVCGMKNELGKNGVCKNAKCRREHQRIYLKEYRRKNIEKVRQWLRDSQKRRLAKRGPNHCLDCGIEVNNYHIKYCDNCKHKKSLEYQKNYYELHKKQEATRKAIWFQNNKKNILERRKSRSL